MHSKLQMKHTNDISQAIGRFKHNLGRVFDDNLHTKQWQNMVDYAIIGILGIAIFAVPAGLVASAFSEVMEKDEKKEKIAAWANTLHFAFERKMDRPTGVQVVPQYASIVEIQARLGLKEDEILDAVAASDDFRLINLSATRPTEKHPEDQLTVEHFAINTCYGQCIDRGSRITIFSPSNITDPMVDWWAYYLAKIGGFIFVSRELGESRPYRSFFTYNPDTADAAQNACMADLNRLANCEDKWVVSILAASGVLEPNYPTQFHFSYGNQKGDETYSAPDMTIHNVSVFDTFYTDYTEFAQQMEQIYHLQADRQRYHNNASPAYFARHLTHHPTHLCCGWYGAL